MSYQVLVKPGKIQDVHADQLKPYVQDVLSGRKTDLFFHTTGYKPLATEVDEYDVKKILAHRENADGKLEFLTWWEGCPKEQATWEPPISFLTRYCEDFPLYLLQHGIAMDAREVWHGSQHVRSP